MTSYVYGIDVSAYQGSNITSLLKNRDFCFVKATEGSHTTDSGWSSRLDQARDAGVVTGLYHFGHPENSVSGDASHFVDTIRSHLKPGDLLALDMEMSAGESGAQVTAWKDSWINKVQDALPDNLVGLYCSRNGWVNYETTSNAGDYLWIANYTTASDPNIQYPWTIWQYTSSPVDTNRAKFATRADMRTWAMTKYDANHDGDDNGGGDDDNGGDGGTTPFPGASHFGPGQSNAYVTQLGDMLVARGASGFYQTGTGPTWTDVDGAACAAFQSAQGWTGSEADGIPGPSTWNLLTTGAGHDIPYDGSHLPFPSARWFQDAPNCWIVTAMGKRLVAEGCSCYSSGPSNQWTSVDACSYACWQHQQGYTGSAADGIPGPSTWNALRVPDA